MPRMPTGQRRRSVGCSATGRGEEEGDTVQRRKRKKRRKEREKTTSEKEDEEHLLLFFLPLPIVSLLVLVQKR